MPEDTKLPLKPIQSLLPSQWEEQESIDRRRLHAIEELNAFLQSKEDE